MGWMIEGVGTRWPPCDLGVDRHSVNSDVLQLEEDVAMRTELGVSEAEPPTSLGASVTPAWCDLHMRLECLCTSIPCTMTIRPQPPYVPSSLKSLM